MNFGACSGTPQDFSFGFFPSNPFLRPMVLRGGTERREGAPLVIAHGHSRGMEYARRQRERAFGPGCRGLHMGSPSSPISLGDVSPRRCRRLLDRLRQGISHRYKTLVTFLLRSSSQPCFPPDSPSIPSERIIRFWKNGMLLRDVISNFPHGSIVGATLTLSQMSLTLGFAGTYFPSVSISCGSVRMNPGPFFKFAPPPFLNAFPISRSITSSFRLRTSNPEEEGISTLSLSSSFCQL